MTAINRIIGARRPLNGDQGGIDPTAAGLLTGLVLYAPLSNNTLSVGPVASLTENSSPTYTTGHVGNCVSFNGSSSLSIANASMGDLKFTGSFSVSFWFKTDKITGFGENFCSWLNLSGAQRAWWCFWEGVSDKIWFGVSANGSNSQPANYLQAEIAPFYGTHSPTTWYFWVSTYDDTTKTGTLNINNGAMTATDTKTNAGVHSSTADFFVGKDAGGRNIQGDVDELGLWNRVLTADEIAYLYNGGLGRTYPFT